jgi:hypothetical protein
VFPIVDGLTAHDAPTGQVVAYAGAGVLSAAVLATAILVLLPDRNHATAVGEYEVVHWQGAPGPCLGRAPTRYEGARATAALRSRAGKVVLTRPLEPGGIGRVAVDLDWAKTVAHFCGASDVTIAAVGSELVDEPGSLARPAVAEGSATIALLSGDAPLSLDALRARDPESADAAAKCCAEGVTEREARNCQTECDADAGAGESTEGCAAECLRDKLDGACR